MCETLSRVSCRGSLALLFTGDSFVSILGGFAEDFACLPGEGFGGDSSAQQQDSSCKSRKQEPWHGIFNLPLARGLHSLEHKAGLSKAK